MLEWALLAVVVVLVLACGVFVAAEFSLVTLDRASVMAEAEAGNRSANGIVAALRSLSTQLSGAQVGITITSLVIGFLAEPAIATLLQGPITAWGVPESSALAVSLTLALILATVAQMLFSELIPKNWAISQPRRVAGVVTPLQRGFTRAVGPLIRVTNGNANWLLRKMGIEPVEELASARSAQELQYLVRHSGESGTMPAATAALLDRSLRFAERQAEDVMTPRTQVEMVDSKASVAHTLQFARDTGFSRFPVVHDGDPDEVVGIITLRDALQVSADLRATTPVAAVMTPVVLIPDTLPLEDVLPMVRGGNHLLVVIDEYGGTAGLLTLEDLVEELVGEVSDEHDDDRFRSLLRADGSWLISGLLRPEEARDIGIDLPDDLTHETVAGLILTRLGRMADVGDCVDVDGWRLCVQALDGLRIDLLTAEQIVDSLPMSPRSGDLA